VRSRRLAARLVDLETVDDEISAVDTQEHVDRRFSAVVLLDLVRRLRPLDRQIILLYLEGESGGAIAEVTGLSATHVATKVHRIKRMLKQSYSTLLLRSHASPWLFVARLPP
jgi:RNA polymerase sigma-70 factor (ECF subfamily)